MLSLALIFYFLFPTFAQEEHHRPLYEIGVFGGVVDVPDYPASEQSHVHFLTLPVVYYHGKIFRSEQDGIARIRFVTEQSYGVDLSLSGSFPTNSKDNDMRQGMPDLQWLAELGPRFYFYLLRTKDQYLRVNLPVRGALSTNFTSLTPRGMIFAPGVSDKFENIFNLGVDFATGVNVNFVSRDLAGYFYDVPRDFANSRRDPFTARGGYLGTDVFAGVIRRWPQWLIFTGAKASFYNGATNFASPLFRNPLTTAAYAGFVWTFFESEEPGYD